MALFSALIAGLIFGFGLLLSGMGNPAKVLGFLDLAGNWDPSLLFVMGGAMAVAAVAFAVARTKTTSALKFPLVIPMNRHCDTKLILGSILFGIGWGLAGICPGPALLLLGAGFLKGLVFVAAMLIGMLIFEYQAHRNRAKTEGSGK